MTSDTLSVFAGVVLSLALSYLPGVRQWYGRKDEETKALVNLFALILVGAVVFALSCGGIQPIVSCDQRGAWALAQAIFLAAVANMTTHGITKKIAPVASK